MAAASVRETVTTPGGGGGYRGNQRERSVDVPGNSRGVDTGIDVRAGEPITNFGNRNHRRRPTCR
jgi:hypothetical protein